jgi:hypothetical protein
MNSCVQCCESVNNDKFHSNLKCGHYIHSMCLLLLSNYSLSCPKCKKHLVYGTKLTPDQEESQLIKTFNKLCINYLYDETNKNFSKILLFTDTHFSLIMRCYDRFEQLLISKYKSGWYFIGDVYYSIYQKKIVL